MRNISKSFGRVDANAHVSLDLEGGEIRALLGENGAGKTTLMNILYGIYPHDSGSIEWKGKEVRFGSPREAIAAGIGMVHQHFMLVPTLSVAENVVLGLKPRGHPFPDRKAIAEEVRTLSRRYGLDVDPEAEVSSLSVGERQRTEILKLLYRNADLLILDEPTAVLTPVEIESFFSVLRRLKAEGHAVILIAHRIHEVLAVADRITVLRDGRVVATEDAASVGPEELSRLMIGRPLKMLVRPRRQRDSVEPTLAVENLSAAEGGAERLRGLSLSVFPGEIFGIAGVDGNGQKELAECLLGLRRAAAGTVLLRGEKLDGLPASERRLRGMAYISDDRHADSLVLDMDLADNYFLGFHDDASFVRGPWADRARCTRETAEAIARFRIKAQGPSAPARLLSGGNQQKLVLAREFARNPMFLVAFQPSRGLDIGAAEFVGERLLEAREAGCAVLLISADLEELLTLSDRFAVLFRGRLSGAMENEGKIDLTRIGLLMAGHEEGEEACAR